MSLPDASFDVASLFAELIALAGASTTIATGDRPAQKAPSPPDKNAAVATTTERTVFPVTILGPTNSSSQAPTIRHDENDVDTPYQQGNVTLRSSDANNNNSRQQMRPNSNAEQDDDDGGTNSRRRIYSPPQRFLHRKGCDSYDDQIPRGLPLERDDAGDYPPTPNQQSGCKDGGDNSRYNNRQRNHNNQHQDDYRQYNDDNRNSNDYRRASNDNRQYQDDDRRNYDDFNPSRDNRNTGPSYGMDQRNNSRRNDGNQRRNEGRRDNDDRRNDNNQRQSDNRRNDDYYRQDDDCYDNDYRVSDDNRHQYDDRQNNDNHRSDDDQRQNDGHRDNANRHQDNKPNRDNRNDTFRRQSDHPPRDNRNYEDSRRNENSHRGNYSANNRNYDNFRDGRNDNFRQEDGNSNRSGRNDTTQGYNDSPPRDYHQNDDSRYNYNSNSGNRNTDGRQYNDNQYDKEHANDNRTTPRTTVRSTDNPRLLESRDTRIPDKLDTVPRTSEATRKHASPPREGITSRKRQASPPGSHERPTYARTFTGDQDYNPRPQWDVQETPSDTRVSNLPSQNHSEIVTLSASNRIVDYDLQTVRSHGLARSREDISWMAKLRWKGLVSKFYLRIRNWHGGHKA